MSLHVGEDIGDYRIVSMIGAGSMGQVFQVEHRITKRKEALKVLGAGRATESQVQRFHREIEVQARLDHPNIARLHNALHGGESLMLVMEFVEGESLERKLQRGEVSRTAGIQYIHQLLSALEYAHAQGIVHRDVSPGNLIVNRNGHVKLTDFGVAKSLGDYQLTNAGEIVGSLHYMPPEQVRRHTDPDPRSDLYSVAAVLYQILTGKKLFDLADKLSLMVAQVQQQPVPPIQIDPSIGSGLNAVVMKGLAKDPADRHQSAKEFREALERISTGHASTPRTKMPAATAAVIFVALALTGGAARFSLDTPLPLPPAPAPISGIGTLLLAKPNPVELKPEPIVATHPKHVHPRPQPPAVVDQIIILPPQPKITAAAIPSTIAPVPKTIAPIRPTPAPPAAPAAEPEPPVHKKHFWNKLNPFKRKKSLSEN